MVIVVGVGVSRLNLPFADNGVKIVVVMYYYKVVMQYCFRVFLYYDML